MFEQGSRYHDLTESSVLTAQGERLHGLAARPFVPRPANVQHVVQEGERLDLLAFHYYGEATKWWQIADANADGTFPPALLDAPPFVKERLMLKTLPEDASFAARYDQLRLALASFGSVLPAAASFFAGETRATTPSFLAATLTVLYVPSVATRRNIIATINKRFRLRAAFAWPQDGQTAEAFTFDDPHQKTQWQALLARLKRQSGLLELRSEVMQMALELVYHSGLFPRATLLALLQENGFAVADSVMTTPIGKVIFIPPNQLA